MRPPEELDSVDWASLRHGLRADASNVPRIIRALYEDDGRSAHERVSPLWVLTRWNEVYSATLAAIPFLAHAAAHVPLVRAELIHRLANIADGRGPECAGRSDEDAAAHDLVLAELPALLRFLEDPDPATRRAVVTLTPLASRVGEDVWDRLARRYEEDPDGQVRADAFSALAGPGGAGGPRAEAVRRWTAGAVTDPEPLVRARAAVLLLERAGTPYPVDQVEVLAEALAQARLGKGPRSTLAGLRDPDAREARVLGADPGAMALVARRSIDAGDRGERGSRLAARLASTWRDRDEEAFDLLRAALPYGHGDTFRRLGELLPYVPRADRPGVADEVLPHAQATGTDADGYGPRSARLLLGRLGDTRVEALLPHHRPGTVPDTEDDADVLGELAAATGRLHLWRSVLRSAHLRQENRALDALSPAVTAELHPELVALLRARRHVQPVATALAEAGVATAEVMAALTELSREPDGYEPPADAHTSWDVMALQDRGTATTGNRITAAVALARLGGPPELALTLLAEASDGWLALARHLGPAGRPLLPRVEAALMEPARATRLWAAQAHRRITGDAYARCVPVLTDLVRPGGERAAHDAPPPPSALATLAELGVTPDEIRPHLRTWADSERRIIPCDARHGPPEDDLLRAAARAHLSLLADR
ncbi:hypothetical protein [Streptomyces virginiae]|uniref:hypothetical protein n=1 Tax=Streptomyces virginiae TaxID=1961 RepID=UPI00225BBAC8|nr:hypothetical protein [Streptomyces virginiae]MCX4717516.1 hypothetical protein [Streptomyces virginiae]MCX5277367.1 hypothetical protein [Streptomyces virginiae]